MGTYTCELLQRSQPVFNLNKINQKTHDLIFSDHEQLHYNKHWSIPRLVEWSVISMSKEREPRLTILRHLQQPVSKCRSAIATRVSQAIARWQQPNTEIDCKPCFPA